MHGQLITLFTFSRMSSITLKTNRLMLLQPFTTREIIYFQIFVLQLQPLRCMARSIVQIFMALFSVRQQTKIVTISLKLTHAVAVGYTNCYIIMDSLSKMQGGIDWR